MKGQWEERFERSCGHWRAFVDDVVYAFLDCGDLQQGLARVFCDACHSEYLLAFSCSRRGVCPSCAAKRGAIFGAFLREEILEPVPHCMWTFTIPKLLRPYFLHHRPLLGPGMVATVHTAASDLRFHPHIHALASRARRRQCEAKGETTRDTDATHANADDDGLSSADRRRLRRQWAELIRRIYEVDPLLCSCGAQMRILSFITAPPVVQQILQHLHTQGIDPARGPPPPFQPLALVS